MIALDSGQIVGIRRLQEWSGTGHGDTQMGANDSGPVFRISFDVNRTPGTLACDTLI
jgi:hypothetical protein